MEDNEAQYLDLLGLEYYHRKFKELIPEKTSLLQNDSHFVTAEDVDTIMLRMIGIIPATNESGLSIFFVGNTQLEEFDPNVE